MVQLAFARSILAEFLLNLSDFEIASVEVLSQRLELVEQLQSAHAQLHAAENGPSRFSKLQEKLRKQQRFLRVAKPFLLALARGLEAEHQKLEALVTECDFASQGRRRSHQKIRESSARGASGSYPKRRSVKVGFGHG